MRPTVTASTPSSVSRPRATETMSRWRAVSSGSCATLEALGRAEPVADGAVERDVNAPGEACDEPAAAEDTGGAEHDEHGRADEPVHRVVDGDRARVELARREALAGAEQQREVWRNDSCEGDADVTVLCDLDGAGGEQHGEAGGIGEAS